MIRLPAKSFINNMKSEILHKSSVGNTSNGKDNAGASKNRRAWILQICNEIDKERGI